MSSYLKNKLILNLGKQPVTNQFTKKFRKKIKKYDLTIVQEKDTGLIKLRKPFPSSSLIPKVHWVTYNEPEDHLDKLYNEIKKNFINKKSKLLGLTYKDQSFINRFQKNNYNAELLDSYKDLGLSKKKGIESIQNSFTQKKINRIVDKYGKQDILIIRHVWEHVYDLEKFTYFIKQLIKRDGYILLEVPDYSKLLKNFDYTMIWEEHLYYYNKYTFLNNLRKYKLSPIYFKKITYPNEDVLITLVKIDKNIEEKKSFREIRNIMQLANNYKNKFNYQKKSIQKKLKKLSKNNQKIFFYGGGHLSISFILYFNLQKYIYIIIDDNDKKDGYYIPGANIKIIYSKKIKITKHDMFLISANQINEKKIIKKLINREVLKENIYSIFPTSRIFIGN